MNPHDLTGRLAVCRSVHHADHTTEILESSSVRPSSENLPFFEFRGIGSDLAISMCLNCHFHRKAHVYGLTHICTNNCPHCNNFVSHGPWEYDVYYCGHSGWD